MAGILASSASKTMTPGETQPDDAESGYVTGEQIALSVTPAATTFSWGIAKPSGATVRANLSGTTDATPVFTPDVAGFYVVTVTVDSSTSYVIRLSVTQVAITTAAEAVRFQPKADASVPAPARGEALFFSSNVSRLRVKTTAGAVRDIDPSARIGTFTLVAGSAVVADASVTAATRVMLMATAHTSPGFVRVAVNAGVGFTVTSTSGTDTSTYSYSLIG